MINLILGEKDKNISSPSTRVHIYLKIKGLVFYFFFHITLTTIFLPLTIIIFSEYALNFLLK